MIDSALLKEPLAWNIRFGQILRHQIERLDEKIPGQYKARLQDCFFFHPDQYEVIIANKPAPTPYHSLDLNHNVRHYRKYFTSSRSTEPTPLDTHFFETSKVSYFIVPGFGHESLPQKPFDGELQHLIDMGASIHWLEFDESSKGSVHASEMIAQQMQEIMEKDERHWVAISYSYGIHALLQALSQDQIQPHRDQIKAVVSLGGPLSSSSLDENKDLSLQKAILHLIRHLKTEPEKPIEAKIVSVLKNSLKLKVPWSQSLMELIEIINRYVDDIELPSDTLAAFGRPKEKWLLPDEFPKDIELFSISAAFPQDQFALNTLLPQELDNLFLFLTSLDAYQDNPFCDGVFFTKDMQFPPKAGTHLATLHSDHWGLAYPYIFNPNQMDSFPRPAMFESIILILDEFLKTSSEESS